MHTPRSSALGHPHPAFLWAELMALFVALPVALAFAPRGWLFVSLWVVLIYAGVVMGRRRPDLRALWRGTGLDAGTARIMGLRLALSAALIVAVVLWLVPDKLLGFPREMPQLWLMVMLLYPFLSALPQEFLFRAFFFWRYEKILPQPVQRVVASGLTFALAHVVMQNWVAPLLCVSAGLIFADGYQRHRSLKWVWLEHTVYGWLIFTLGLGWFFYSGAARGG